MSEQYRLERETDEGEIEEFDLEFEIDITPNEYEGGYLYASGDVEIYDVTCDGQPFDLTKDERRRIEARYESQIPSDHYRASWL